VLAAVALVACGGRAPEQPGEARIKVLTTTNIVGDLVRTIGEPHIEVESLMGPGIDPHLYKASAGDVRRMSSAAAIFYSGLHLEGKMSEVLEKLGERDVRTLAVAECVPHEELIRSAGFSGVHDPHVWFDVALWSDTVECVTEMLVELEQDSEPRELLQALAAHGGLESFTRFVPGLENIFIRAVEEDRSHA